jgi:GntR family carbon starvation induced transcriptional regulator
MSDGVKSETRRAAQEARSTATSIAYLKIRQDVVLAHYAPGEKLNIKTICERHDIGLSTAREALGRLSRERLIVYLDQRGFFIAPLKLEALDELVRTRCWLNEIGIRESIIHGDQAWEEQLILSYHRFIRLPRYLNEELDAECNAEWEEAHRTYHASLISACRSQWLIAYAEQLFDAADYYRHLSRVSRQVRRKRTDEHEAIMKAALDRDADRAADLLRSHFSRTAQLIHDRLKQRLT